MRSLHWFESGEGVSPDSIRQVERIVGVRFSDDYFEFILKHSGANNPDESEFVIESVGGHERIGNFGEVLKVDGDGHDSVLGTLRNLAEQIPAGVVPVIGTGSGDYICLDARRPEKPVSVCYFYHGRSGDDAIVPLARSFSDFLEMLSEPEDE